MYDPDLSEALHMNVLEIEGLVAVGYGPSTGKPWVVLSSASLRSCRVDPDILR